ncbi:LacI family DNA-binding transcriptional regulator [Dyadobacter fanqingshengii]|uniref:LacI family transcriptional regulator n=1 Tax=Dyadobacter fanqingshengii TaxID=2906443 RepID=A0A9X1PGJ3_9BACT|nr:LacI family DNA-binding transcriptional regulator [Dyadobacter fanqingshengii]MCF0043328.1 LacI family transcriptional regulator [Dyadobacter fanqingshengii]MCF2504236.1 LacI family transcriptional regulator [Dyadobacter fanqingshengii]USJ35800.1 LacI family transcriptional regulator [Dyadobacter fanqingshengii]
METITIKDIAKALGLSTSTVSRALRNSYEINPETKKLVMEYAERMNYRPNPIALSLRDSKSKSIGVIIPEIANHFFSQLINGIESIAYNLGYHVVIFQSHESYEREVANTNYLVSRKVDGLLISLSSLTTNLFHFQDLMERGLPIVFLDRVPNAIETHKVVVDNFAGSYEATEHLIKSGRKRIAHLTSPIYLSITTERLAGYKQALEDNGLPFDESYVKYCYHGGKVATENEAAVQEMLEMPEPPDAIFTASDRLTTGCMSVLQKKKIRIPEQIAIVGFTNISVAELLNPPLTAVVQPAMEMGQQAVELLIRLIEHPQKTDVFETRSLKTSLIIRESSVGKAEAL